MDVVDLDTKRTATQKTSKKSQTKAAVAKRVQKKTPTSPKPKKAVKKAAKKVTKKVVAKKAVVKRAAKKATAKKATKKVATKKNVAKEATEKVTLHRPKPKTKKIAQDKGVTVPLNTHESTINLKREPLGHLLVEKKLREAGFNGGISSDKTVLEKYSTDESIFAIRPQIVILPDNQHDVETAVRVIAAETSRFPSLSLTPRAAGTGLSGGSLTDSIVIDVCRMNHIDLPVSKKGDVSITCEPGAMWKDVEKVLKTNDVYLPSAPASKDICTIGGSVANNAAGPDSLKFGHTAEWVTSMDVTLHDAKTYTIKPLSYKEFKALIKKDHAHAQIAKRVFGMLEKEEKTILGARPHTKKNTAGFPLWDVLSDGVAAFKKGTGTFDLTRIISGSQGTIGIITKVTLCTEPILDDTTLLVLPIFDLQTAGKTIRKALEYDPVNVEIFDDLTFDLALQNPSFFKSRLESLSYYRVMLSLYTTYHVRFRRKIPQYTLLVTVNDNVVRELTQKGIRRALQESGCRGMRFVKAPEEKEMWWQVRRASYTLSKLQDPSKRPAAFLEDMTVPPENLVGFLKNIGVLFKKFDITAAVHGHGGNGHFHFYPLLDFTKEETPELIEKMSEEFFECAIKHGGSLCGEHNDGIIRTPHLKKMYKAPILRLFAELEHTFDPDDIFNPGKKVNPRFDIRDSLRHTN